MTILKSTQPTVPKKTFVIKCGGSLLTNLSLLQSLMQDICALQNLNMSIVLVHGGGPEITKLCAQFQLPTQFIQGQRVTNKETMSFVQMALVGKTNCDLVNALNANGARAAGVSGLSCGFIQVTPLSPELGFVGKIQTIHPSFLNLFLQENIIPVVAPIGVDDLGQSYNVNADIAAGYIAASLKSDSLIVLSDVDGVYASRHDASTRLSTLSTREIKDWIATGKAESGMIPKLEACMVAACAGVKNVQIVNGNTPHILDCLHKSTHNIGTQIIC